jgi:hypothetical protein
MLEEPVAATERILPWVVTTHIKDGAIFQSDKGIETFTARCGQGVIDLEKILRILASSGKEINLSIEDHGGSFFLPVNEKWFIERFPDISTGEFNSLKELSGRTIKKMRNSMLRITQRNEWPGICEEMTRDDLIYLKSLRDRVMNIG